MRVRPAPAPPFLESAIAAAERDGRAERVELGPLTQEAAAELLAGIPEPRIREAVFRVSGGNPFDLSQLARVAVSQPVRADSPEVDTLTLGVPQSGDVSMLDEEVRSLPPGAGLEQLTEREREIAELVCDRHTNRQIAAELFVSEKTVETHLRNIFAKLGVGSRVEVARAVERARP